MERKKLCFGCGCILQNTDPGMPGYTPKSLDEEMIYCQRCFRLQHYGENNDDSLLKPDYKTVFSGIIKKKCLIIYVVDLFAMESSLIRDLLPFIKENPILVVANKRDILPKSVDDDKLRQFVFNKFRDEGIEIQDVICSSAYKNYNIDEIIDACNALRHGKDIYIVGASSVGKSSLINALLKTIKNQTRDLISTSPYPGTTIATITIPLDNHSKIYDTPGIVSHDSIFAFMEKSALKYIIPKTEIKPITYQLNSKQSVFIGGIARIDFVEGGKTGFTFYCSNNIQLHRTKLDKANQVFDTLVGQGKIKPTSTTIPSSAALEKYDLVLPNKKVDIVYSGLCWINVKGNGQKVSLWAPRGVSISIRDPKI